MQVRCHPPFVLNSISRYLSQISTHIHQLLNKVGQLKFLPPMEPHYIFLRLPICKRFGYCFSSPSLNAHWTNKEKQFSWIRPSKLYVGAVPITVTTKLFRVVTIILLPLQPLSNKSSNSFQFKGEICHLLKVFLSEFATDPHSNSHQLYQLQI